MFLFAILFCLGVVLVLYFQLEKSSAKSNTGNIGNEGTRWGIHKVGMKSTTRIGMKQVQEILFQDGAVSMNRVLLPLNHIEDKNATETPDYADLDLVFFEEDNVPRPIVHDFHLDKTEYREPEAKFDDDYDLYYAFDDDYERGYITAYDSNDKVDEKKRCRRTSFHRRNLQNCNNIHEVGQLESRYTFLGEGAYRQVFSVDHSYSSLIESVVLKDLSYDNHVDYADFEFIRMDAMVAELTTSSPLTFDIYGFCANSILSEFFPHGDVEQLIVPGEGYMKTEDLHDEEELKPQNHLTGKQKLVLALSMAEALAVLHGYKDGLIVHDDVQLSQYLFNADKTVLKLNDFNRAEFLLFDEENQKYCLYKNGQGHGNWRSPEEYKDKPLTEQIDVWSLGNNMYGLLTGLNPLYNVTKSKNFKRRIVRGETAFIDPRYQNRSHEEAALVQVIERTFAYYPHDRPTMFEVVDMLKQAVDKSLLTLDDGEQESPEDVMQSIVLKRS